MNYQRASLIMYDEYAMTSFKRRKVTDSKESESEDDLEQLQAASTKKKLTRKMIEADDLDVLDENEGIDDKVGNRVLFLMYRIQVNEVSLLQCCL